MFLSRSLLLVALVVGAGPASAAQTRAFVLTTDFSTGGLSVVDLATRAVSRDVAAGVCADARIRWHGGLLHVVNRLGCDNVLVLDPERGFAVVRQFSVGNGSNPADIAFVSPTKAYVTRYERAGLLIVNPATGATLGQISLAPFADGDGIPEMDRMVRVGNRVFVTVQRLDRNAGFQPTDASHVVVIDAEADTVLDVDPGTPGVQAIRLPGTNPVTVFAFDRASSRLLVGCVGRYGVLDGGIAWVDPILLRSDGFAITEAALGGDVLDFAWTGRERSYAIVSDAAFNTCLVSWSAASGSRLANLHCPGGFRLADLEPNDRGELYVCDNFFTAPGLFVFSTATGEIVAGPLDTGLPPFEVVFDSTAGVVSAAPPGPSLGFLAPWPNPARDVTRVAFDLERPALARAEVFDLGGRLVRILSDGPRPTGRSEIAWDLRDGGGRRVAEGVYLLRARIREKLFVRRVVVLY